MQPIVQCPGIISGMKSLLVFVYRRIATMSSNWNITNGLSSSITLNDGVVMPLFGFGTYKLSSADGGDAETITSFALQNGYRLFDTAASYRHADCLFARLNSYYILYYTKCLYTGVALCIAL